MIQSTEGAIMNDTRKVATAESAGDFDARAAAAMLDQTTVQARRQFEPYPPWLLAIRAVLALIVYGALWLSVRGQHPYSHPTAAVIPVGVGVGIVNLLATLAVAKRATAGIGGRSRLRTAEIGVVLAVWIGVFVVMVGMADAGVGNRIVYGLYPATAPLIVAGLAWAGIMAARAEWRACATGLAAAAVGAVALSAGPAGAWAVVGVGLCVTLLVRAAEIALRQRA
jgi:hypothetical protein